MASHNDTPQLLHLLPLLMSVTCAYETSVDAPASPYSDAVYRRQWAIVDRLLRDPRVVPCHAHLDLVRAASDGACAVVSALLRRSYVIDPTFGFHAALSQACEHDQLDVVTLLLADTRMIPDDAAMYHTTQRLLTHHRASTSTRTTFRILDAIVSCPRFDVDAYVRMEGSLRLSRAHGAALSGAYTRRMLRHPRVQLADTVMHRLTEPCAVSDATVDTLACKPPPPPTSQSLHHRIVARQRQMVLALRALIRVDAVCRDVVRHHVRAFVTAHAIERHEWRRT